MNSWRNIRWISLWQVALNTRGFQIKSFVILRNECSSTLKIEFSSALSFRDQWSWEWSWKLNDSRWESWLIVSWKMIVKRNSYSWRLIWEKEMCLIEKRTTEKWKRNSMLAIENYLRCTPSNISSRYKSRISRELSAFRNQTNLNKLIIYYYVNICY